MTVRTVAGLLGDAVETGRRVAAIKGEWKLWVLSKPAWTRRCLELAGWASLADLEAARDRLVMFPHLNRELAIRGRLWADRGQDQPALYMIDGERFPAAYSELLASNMTIEQVSAIASFMVVDMRPDTAWGEADAIGEDGDGARALAPHEARLAELDAQLAGVVLFAQATWAGGRWTIAHSGVEVVMDGVTARTLASTFAEQAGLRADASPTTAAAA